MSEPNAKLLLRCKNKKDIIKYAKKIGANTVEGANYIFVGHLKCVLDRNDKLLFIQ